MQESYLSQGWASIEGKAQIMPPAASGYGSLPRTYADG